MSYQLRVALDEPYAMILLFGGTLVAFAVFLPLSRRMGWSPAWTLLALLSLAPVLAFTVPPGAATLPVGAGGRAQLYLDSFLDPFTVRSELGAAGSDDERLANLLLFIPFGLFGALTVRRPVWVAACGIALSFLIEGSQAVSGSRVASAGDWLHNSAGALTGAVIGGVLLLLVAAVQALTGQPRVTRPPAAEPVGEPAGRHRAPADPWAGLDGTTVSLAQPQRR
jgi:glycopeptide antibiotics resistance protein